MEQIFILSGTNMGDKSRNLSDALKLLETEIIGNGFRFKNPVLSSVIESEPWGFEAEETFLNQAISLYSDIPPYRLLEVCQKVEKEIGKDVNKPRYDGRGNRIYHSRLIDLDILFYGGRIIETSELVIPHPRIQSRLFVLNPLCEIAPDFTHPVLKTTIKELRESIKHSLSHRIVI